MPQDPRPRGPVRGGQRPSARSHFGVGKGPPRHTALVPLTQESGGREMWGLFRHFVSSAIRWSGVTHSRMVQNFLLVCLTYSFHNWLAPLGIESQGKIYDFFSKPSFTLTGGVLHWLHLLWHESQPRFPAPYFVCSSASSEVSRHSWDQEREAIEARTKCKDSHVDPNNKSLPWKWRL